MHHAQVHRMRMRRTGPTALCARGMNSVVLSPKSAIEAARNLQDELIRCRLEAEETRQRLVDFISTASDVMWETDADLRIVSGHTPTDLETEDNNYFLGRR